MSRIGAFFERLLTPVVRTLSFVSKEIVEIIYQPRLVLIVVLGPFLILLLFGIGYRNEPQALQTLFVVPENSELRAYIEEYATTLGPQLIFVGMTPDRESALEQLRAGLVDVVIVTPTDVYEKFQNNEQAVFTVYHNKIDPIEVSYVASFGQIYVSEVNRRVLSRILSEGQQETAPIEQDIESARGSTSTLRQALEAGNTLEADRSLRELDQDVETLKLAVGAQIRLLNAIQDVTGREPGSDPEKVLSAYEDLSEIDASLEELSTQPRSESLEQVTEIEQNLDTIDSALTEFRRTDPNLLVSLFGSETESIAPVELDASSYYTPSVIIVLLQHLCVTVAGLSIISERQSGAVELFQVAPLSAFEILVGKYLSALVFIAVIVLALTGILVFGLDVPMIGSWWNYVLVLLALVLVSLGLGYLISLLSTTTSQVVQYAMILLLASVFFSGFFLSLQSLWLPVRILSWMLPATYGIRLLQGVMLRGYEINIVLITALGAMAVVLFLVSWVLLHRMLKRG